MYEYPDIIMPKFSKHPQECDRLPEVAKSYIGNTPNVKIEHSRILACFFLFRPRHVACGTAAGKRISEDTPPFLNLEDPIEVQRNLNFALTEATALEPWRWPWHG